MRRVSSSRVLATVWLLGTPIVGMAADVTSWTDVAQQLVARRAATAEGVVDYRIYGFQVDQATFDHLAALLVSSQVTPNPLLKDEVDAWLEAHMPIEHGAMEGWCTFDESLWQDHKKVASSDTLQQALATRALNEGAKVVRVDQVVTMHSDGVTETTVRDHRAVQFKNAPANVHPLSLIDLSLFDWQQGIDQGAAPGQTIEWLADGSAHTISITNGQPGDDIYSGADQTFDEALGWAPLRVTMHFQGQVQVDHVYGYQDDGDADGNPARPTVVLLGSRRADGMMQVDLWIVESWQEWSDPEWLILRLPPYYLLQDYRDEPNPPLEIHQPSYLVNVPREQWLQRAMQRLLDKWGTDDAEVDYNCDGVIDDADTAAAVKALRTVVEE